MDTYLFFIINQNLQNPFFDLIMPFITSRAYILFMIIIVPVLFKGWKKGIFVTLLAIVAFTIADASANILKHFFERQRPCQVIEGVRLLVGCTKSFSLPSNHAANAFTIAVIFCYFFRWTALPVLSIAILVAFSRIYVGVHYPSDVIAGAIWGSLIAWISIFLYRYVIGRRLRRELSRTTNAENQK